MGKPISHPWKASIPQVDRSIDSIRDFFALVTEWAGEEESILAVGLVGSYARGTAKPTSDFDLVLLVREPEHFLTTTGWLVRFGRVERFQIEDYGMLTSLRAWFSDGKEVEFGFSTKAWATLPPDAGTRRVVSDGLRVLFERELLLSRLVEYERKNIDHPKD